MKGAVEMHWKQAGYWSLMMFGLTMGCSSQPFVIQISVLKKQDRVNWRE